MWTSPSLRASARDAFSRGRLDQTTSSMYPGRVVSPIRLAGHYSWGYHMRSRLFVGTALLILSACTSTHTLRREGIAPKLSKEAQVFVSLPADGQFEQTPYAGSGEMTLQAVESAFKRHIVRVERGSAVQAREVAVGEALARGCSHLVIPEILHWEDRATEWSGKRDSIEVRLSLIDPATGAALDVATLAAKSKWFTFGGDHPQELLPQFVGEYVDSLF